MSSVNALAFANAAPIQTSSQRFAGNVEKLNQTAQAGVQKDTDLYIERSDIDVNTLVTQLREGDSVFLPGPGGSGKTLVMAEAFRRLESQGIPTYPKAAEPTGSLLTRGYRNLMGFLDANQGAERVVVGLDEMLTGFIFPGNIDKLKAIQTQYPNVRFIATQDRYGADAMTPDSEEGQFVNSTFGQRHPLQHQNNWYDQLNRALITTGFTLPVSMQRDVAQFLQDNFTPNNLGIRKYIMGIVDALRADTTRVDSDQPEEIPGSVIRKVFVNAPPN